MNNMLQEYNLIKNRRNWSTIYQCKHYTHYMKVWSQEMIQSEVDMYSMVQEYWFPLPQLLEYKIENDDISYMKEESLEGNLFADVFTNDCEKYWEIQKNHFDSFCLYQKNHLFFQLKTTNKNITKKEFDWFDDLYNEWKISTELINKVKDKIQFIDHIFPTVWNHGDHNPYNIFTDWLIDLEDCFEGVLWYDTITALTQNFWFPKEWWELNQQHYFTKSQIHRYLKYCTRKEVDFLDNDIFGTLFLMRGIFATVKTIDFPLLHDFRYDKLTELMHKYIEWSTDFIEYFIENYRTKIK